MGVKKTLNQQTLGWVLIRKHRFIQLIRGIIGRADMRTRVGSFKQTQKQTKNSKFIENVISRTNGLPSQLILYIVEGPFRSQ